MLRRQITIGFFLGFLGIALFGCADNRTSYSEAPNRNNQPVANERVAGSTNNNTTSPNAMSSTNGMSMNGNSASMPMQDNFWAKAAAAGMAEVEMGKLAAQKATNPEVKKFAQMMVADHTKSNDEVKMTASKKSVTLPTDLDAAHKAMMTRLQGLSGAEFDKAYMEGQVADHEAAVALMDGNDDNADADIKAFATKSLPAMKAHLDMAKNIHGKLK